MAGRQHEGKLRVAVAGVGSFSQRVLVPGLLACDEAEVAGLFGPTPKKTQDLAQKWGIGRAYSNYLQMLDETEPEAVVVATPNDVHHPFVMEALRRRLAIFCEKPLGINLAQAEEMAAAARAAGVHTAVNFTYRSTNATRHVERLIQDGHLGRLFHFSIAFWQNIRADPAMPLAYRMLRERGGGALLDVGVHMMDLIRWWFGDLDAVCGATYTAITERPTPEGGSGTVTADDTASFVVRLPNGVLGTVQVSQAAAGRQNYRRIELFGSSGSIRMEEDRNFGPEVRVARLADTQFELAPLPEDLDVAFDDFPRFHLSRVVAALRGQTGDFPTFEDALFAQRAIEAVETSQKTGEWVSLR